MQRQLALQIPFAARDFGPVQPARDANLDTLAAKAQRRIDGFSHRSAKCYALFELQRNGFGHQLRIELWFVNFLNIDENFALGLLGEVALELLDFGALAPDNDTRPRGADGDPQLIAGPVHFNRADAGGFQPLAQRALQLQVFPQKLGVVRLGEPARSPGLCDAQTKAVRMYFLSHYAFSSLAWVVPFFLSLTTTAIWDVRR